MSEAWRVGDAMRHLVPSADTSTLQLSGRLMEYPALSFVYVVKPGVPQATTGLINKPISPRSRNQYFLLFFTLTSLWYHFLKNLLDYTVKKANLSPLYINGSICQPVHKWKFNHCYHLVSFAKGKN
jgi:hypothetical protein